MIPKFSDAVTIDWERRDFAFMTVLTVRFCASMQYHIKDGDEVDYEEIKDLVVEQLRLEVANSAGGMLATDERETLERRIDELCQENDQLRQRIDSLGAENAKLRVLCSGLAQVVKNDDDTFRQLREIAKQELSYDFIGMYDSSLGKIDQIARFIDSMAELGIKVGASGDSTKGW